MKRALSSAVAGIALGGARRRRAAVEQALAEEAPPVAIAHATVYVPGGRAPVDDATVVIAERQGAGRGRRASRCPPGARVIDGARQDVTPGFIDADTDVGVVDVDLEPQTERHGRPWRC